MVINTNKGGIYEEIFNIFIFDLHNNNKYLFHVLLGATK